VLPLCSALLYVGRCSICLGLNKLWATQQQQWCRPNLNGFTPWFQTLTRSQQIFLPHNTSWLSVECSVGCSGDACLGPNPAAQRSRLQFESGFWCKQAGAALYLCAWWLGALQLLACSNLTRRLLCGCCTVLCHTALDVSRFILSTALLPQGVSVLSWRGGGGHCEPVAPFRWCKSLDAHLSGL
jgi:hypothetical protein